MTCPTFGSLASRAKTTRQTPTALGISARNIAGEIVVTPRTLVQVDGKLSSGCEKLAAPMTFTLRGNRVNPSCEFQQRGRDLDQHVGDEPDEIVEAPNEAMIPLGLTMGHFIVERRLFADHT